MTFRGTATMDPLAKVFAAEQRRIEREMTSAMRDATGGLKEDLRRQTEAAGLGSRLGRTWQGTVYPQSGESLEPAGYVYSRAPRIIAAFASGATITPRFMNFLAIPTENVPRRIGGRGAKAKMSPRDVERHFGQDLIIRKGRNGSYLGYVDAVRAKSRRRSGFRQATPRRIAQGRESRPILMFIFVRRTKMPKLLDLQATAERWGAQVPRLFDARMGRR